MRLMHDALDGEAHHQARRAPTMEPPTTMGPAPSLDKETNSDPGRRELWGQPLGKKQHNKIRICFQNIGGLITETDGDIKLQVLLQFTQQHQINIFGFAEHNTCWDLLQKTNKSLRGPGAGGRTPTGVSHSTNAKNIQ